MKLIQPKKSFCQMPPNSFSPPPSVWIDPIPIRKTRVSNVQRLWWEMGFMEITSRFSRDGGPMGVWCWLNDIHVLKNMSDMANIDMANIDVTRMTSEHQQMFNFAKSRNFSMPDWWCRTRYTCSHVLDLSNFFLQHKIYWNNTNHPQMMGLWHWVYHIVSNDPSIIHQSSTVVR